MLAIGYLKITNLLDVTVNRQFSATSYQQKFDDNKSAIIYLPYDIIPLTTGWRIVKAANLEKITTIFIVVTTGALTNV